MVSRMSRVVCLIIGFHDRLGSLLLRIDGAPSFPRSESQRRLKSDPFNPVSKPQKPRRRLRGSDSEVESVIVPKSQKIETKSKVPQPKASQSKAPRPQKKSTLFVESDPEDEDDATVPVDKDASQRDDMDSDAEISPHSTIRTESQRRSQWSSLDGRRREPAPADDDSDNEMVFKGFGTGRSQRTQRGTQRR